MEVALIALLYAYVFFHAEDGIRDRNVTGVQTCALPILPVSFSTAVEVRIRGCHVGINQWIIRRELRSEERRVGKEWRWWWAPKQYKKKKIKYSSSHRVALLVCRI